MFHFHPVRPFFTIAILIALASPMLYSTEEELKDNAGKTDLLTDWVIAQGERVMGVATPAGLFQAWGEYRTDDVSPLVIQDVLLMAGAKDHYIPLQMLPDQLMTLTAAHSVTARVFTEAESAQNHCQIGNMGLALKVIFDWLDETGGRTVESADRQ